jgi:class 3 adenylate cyclase
LKAIALATDAAMSFSWDVSKVKRDSLRGTGVKAKSLSAVLHYRDQRTDTGLHIAIDKSRFDEFSPSLLGLGDISAKPSGSEKFDALAAVFDLQGFTSFCDARDPQISVPDFIDEFLSWLFVELKDQFVKEPHGDTVLLWGYLPIFAKFMGDGVLLLWRIEKDERHGGALAIGNIVVRLHQTAKAYRERFLPKVENDFADLPKTLRCGGAFGQVVSVGNGSDYVGACINVASRLQKLGGLSFAFSRKGCNPTKCFTKGWNGLYAAKKIRIRGINKEEPILVDRVEFDALPRKTKIELFGQPK